MRPTVDRREQAALGFGQRSQWLEPWRSYQQTLPASRLRDAPGLNLNVAPEQVRATARLMRANGVRRARLEVGWDAMSYADPGRLSDPGRLRRTVRALGAEGIRPLILLNANDGGPGPARKVTLRLVRPVPAGARTVQLERRSARRVRAGRTGFDRVGTQRSPDLLITRVHADGAATLGRRAPKRLDEGPHPATILRFAPFSPPRRIDGAPDPAFERTLSGWLRYALAVSRTVRSALGSDAFDVEVWNELSFGSDFLRAGAYRQPAPAGRGDVAATILRRTVAALRARGSGLGAIGIGDGFANQSPFPASSSAPPGLTALDKHPYAGARRFPRDDRRDQTSVDATGRPDRTGFRPAYRAFFPEYYLTGIQTETLVRDLSPFTTKISGIAHGRNAGASGRETWITETGMDPSGTGLPASAVPAMRTKAALRFLDSYVSLGAAAVDFYAAAGPDYGLIPLRFFQHLSKQGARGPDATARGPVLAALGRQAALLTDARAPRFVRPLTLTGVAGRTAGTIFRGDGSAGHPTLYDRDEVAFLPFQLADREWVIPTYVMTRDLARTRQPRARTAARYDLPPSPYRLTVRGLDASHTAAWSYDPISGRLAAVRVGPGTASNTVTLVTRLTDAPRLLVVTST